MSVKCEHCGKKYINDYHAKRHIEIMHKDLPQPETEIKRKGWATQFGFVDFKEPVTYEEACESSKVIHELLMARKEVKP